MNTLSVIGEHWWALIAVIGGAASILIDIFLFVVVWRFYDWLNRHAEPVSLFEQRLVALERTAAEHSKMLEELVQQGRNHK